LTNSEQEFLKKLRHAFAFEAKEQLLIISSNLLQLEKQQDGKIRLELVEVMFRQAHNLKGSARAVNMSNIESLCQSLEAALSEMKKGNIPVLENYLDILLLCVDILERLLAEGDKTTEALETTIAKTKQDLARFFSGLDGAVAFGFDPVTTAALQSPVLASATSANAAGPGTAGAAVERVVSMDSIRLSAVKLDELLLQAEEMLTIKRAAIQHAADIASLTDEAQLWKKEWQKFDTNVRALRWHAEKQLTDGEYGQLGGQIVKLLEFLEWNHGRVNGWLSRLNAQRKLVYGDTHTIAVSVDSFLESTKKLLMMPCSVLLEGFPRLVREMSRDLGKDVELTMLGTEIELDRRILTQMRDPLVHLIRNSIDHGIETPAVRRQAGKLERASLTVAINQGEAGKVEISVYDDGAGIDLERVKAAALKSGVISEADAYAMTDEEQVDLIFQSAISTSPIITDISGYGLGLAIVKENVSNLGGKLSVDTTFGVGTTFKMLLPVTIATFQGVLLDLGSETVTVPKANLLRVLRMEASKIQTIENRDAFDFQGSMVPLVRLADLLEIENAKPNEEQSPYLLVAVVRAGDDIIGLIVEEILEEQEVLVKSLGRPLNRVRNIAGVTILRTGEAVPVLNVSDLIKSAKRLAGAPGALSAQLLQPRPKKRILVVDDTLTSRMLVKNIMEAAGYMVKTASDGIEALAELNAEPFDMLLADVEMPRMDGLELTKKVRENAKYAELPVVLLTSLATKEHREKGVQAGANAYFVKGKFDQSGLLDVIKRLI
jgi:two-component system, chemotaxis family, sensor kinase CheA